MTVGFQAEDRGEDCVGIAVDVADGCTLKAAEAQVIAEVRLTEAIEILVRAVTDLRRTIELERAARTPCSLEQRADHRQQ